MTTSLWQQLRADFPITKDYVYLDHASGGPIPRPVHEKIKIYYEEHFRKADYAWMRWIRRREEVRDKVARFIGAEASEIAFIHSTSQGMNLVAELLAGEGSVLTNTAEFPSSTLPWLWRKAKVIWQKPEGAEVRLGRFKKMLSPSVKTILTSHVQYATGFRQDLAALSKLKKGRFLVVNATQALGAFRVNVREWDADFLCSNSYKWLMAGYGGGILYIKKKWLGRFKPLSVGWRSMKNPEAMDNRKLDLKAEAARYEPGCPSFAPIFAVGAAVDYLAGIGLSKIEKRILALTDFAIRGLEKKGLEVISPKKPEHRSGIVVFKAKNAETLRKRLLGRGIYVSARGAGIRIAPHFYNTFEEIEKFLSSLA